MKAVLQRVSRAAVTVDGESVGSIGRGWLVLLGVAKGDLETDAFHLADKVVVLRAFDDSGGKMNLDVTQIGGAVLVVSQFTLMGNCSKGRRPGLDAAAESGEAERLYQMFVQRIESTGLLTATGRFRANMQVELVNDGPVTFLLDSRNAS